MFKEFLNLANEAKFTILGGKLFQTLFLMGIMLPCYRVVRQCVRACVRECVWSDALPTGVPSTYSLIFMIVTFSPQGTTAHTPV